MSAYRFVRFSSLLLAVVVVTGGGQPSGPCLLDCITSLELPRSTDGLPRAWLPVGQDGTVVIRFRLDRSGLIKDLTTSGATKELRVFSERWIRESKFNFQCLNHVIELVYKYQIYNEPVALHLPSVTIQTGTRFILSFPEARPSGPLKQIVR